MVNTETCSWVDKKLMNLLSFSNVKGVSSVIGWPEKTTTFEELIPQLEGFGFPDSQETAIFTPELTKRISLR